MIRRWLTSRAARRFFRSRLAVAAMGIIGLYAAIALAVGPLGMITLDETLQRVGPANVPGLWRSRSPERQLDDCESMLGAVDRALGRHDPAAALADVRFGPLRVANMPPAQLKQLVDRAWMVFDQLAERDDLNQSPQRIPQLEQLEALTRTIFPEPTGWNRWRWRMALALGTDRQGRSIALRGIYSIKVAIEVGAITSLISVVFGSLLGTAAAFFGGLVDHLVIWLYTTFSSIPNLVLLVLLAHMFTGTVFDGTLVPVYVAFCVTFWIGPCRVIRAETLKIKELEYVQAATAAGFGRPYILIRHILPNAAHLMLINFSLLFIGAIKSEVILSFLGLGVKHGPSWGIMISQSGSEVINGFFWQIGAATAMMFFLVLAFNVFSDALQDAFDPKYTGEGA